MQLCNFRFFLSWYKGWQHIFLVQEEEVEDNAERRDGNPSKGEQRPNDVGDDKGMPGEEIQSHSLVDYDLWQDFEKGEFEGSSLTLER